MPICLHKTKTWVYYSMETMIRYKEAIYMFDHHLLREAIVTDKRKQYTTPSKKVERSHKSIFQVLKVF